MRTDSESGALGVSRGGEGSGKTPWPFELVTHQLITVSSISSISSIGSISSISSISRISSISSISSISIINIISIISTAGNSGQDILGSRHMPS